jgi:hypothetical protein
MSYTRRMSKHGALWLYSLTTMVVKNTSELQAIHYKRKNALNTGVPDEVSYEVPDEMSFEVSFEVPLNCIPVTILDSR